MKINIPVNQNMFYFLSSLVDKTNTRISKMQKYNILLLAWKGGHYAVLLQEVKMKGSSSKQCKVSINQKGHFIPVRVEPNLLILRQ